jgi:hypothetical protein
MAMDSEMIRVSMHAASLKFGSKPDLTQHQIDVRGFPLTYAQDRALHAVQSLFDATDYKGNQKPVTPVRARAYRFDGKLPVLHVKSADYLRAYGVQTLKTSRGTIFSPQARRIAIGALEELALTKYSITYFKTLGRRTSKKLPVEEISHLLKLDWDKNRRNVTITPNPVLVDQIESYFMLKPVDIFSLVPDRDPVKVRFLEYLLFQLEGKRRRGRRADKVDPEIRISVENLIWSLHLERLIEQRKPAELRTRLTNLYAVAKMVGYLTSYKVDQPGTKRRIVDVLRLNLRSLLSSTKSRKP